MYQATPPRTDRPAPAPRGGKPRPVPAPLIRDYASI